MKKFLKIAAIVLVLLIGFVLAVPFLFKDKIIATVKETVNEQLNAKVDFGEFDIGIISTFPNLKFSIENVQVDGVAEFDGVRLAEVGRLDLVLDLMSVISGDEYKIKKIYVNQSKIHAKILENGKANWDIAKVDSTTVEEETPDTSSSPFKMALKELKIADSYIVYEDLEGKMKAAIGPYEFELSGDFTENTTDMKMKFVTDTLTYVMDGIPFLNKVRSEFSAIILTDLKNSKYTFKDNVLKINALESKFDGWLAMPNDSIMEMDINFSTTKTTFKEILSLVPAIYAREFASVKTAGNAELKAVIKGQYTETRLPFFDIQLLVSNAMFKYPDLPKSVDKIAIDLKISNPGGSEDLTVIDLRKFHMEMASNPFDMTLFLKTPVSDPEIKASSKGKIDLNTLKDVVPLEQGENIGGVIESDIAIAGKMSALDQGKYDQFKADGRLSVMDLLYETPSLPYATKIKEMVMNFSPQKVELVNFQSYVGKSDFSLKGKLDNIIQYALSDSVTLKGQFEYYSQLLDINELMGSDSDAATPADTASEEPLTVVEVPKNIDFVLNAKIDRVIYDTYDITNVKGNMIVRNQRLSMENVSMNMMDGIVKMSGYYETVNPDKPAFDYSMAIIDWDVQKTATTFNTVEKMAPIAKSAFGKFSSELSVKGLLDDKMEPVMNSLTGKGILTTKNVEIKDFKPLVKLADAIKKPEYKSWALNDVKINFEFSDGKVEVKPFKFKLGKTEVTASGYNTFEQEINYDFVFAIPRSELGSQPDQWAASLTGKTGLNVKLPDIINIKAKMTGTISDPKISTDLTSIGGDLKEQIKEEVKEKIEQKVEEIKEDVKQKAKEEAAKILAEAQKQAEKIRSEAQALAEKTRKEGYSAADEIEAKAKNPLEKAAAKKAADKLRKETDEKAQKIIDEGNVKADKIIEDAKRRAEELEKQ